MPAAGKVFLVALGGLVVLIYVYAAWILLSGAVRLAVRRRRSVRAKAGNAEAVHAAANPDDVHPAGTKARRRAKRSRRHWGWRLARGATLTLAAGGVLCVVSAWHIEPYWPEITRFEVRSDKLPAGSEFVRIVHISDTHCDGDVERLEDKLPDLIRREKPDLIIFTGDAANDWPAGTERFRRMMARIAEIAPTYAVDGNWDFYVWNRLLTGIDVTPVGVRPIDIDIRGARLRLIGGARWQAGHVVQSLEPLEPERVTILLNHYPDFILQIDEHMKKSGAGVRMPDLFLSGHTHGGQICLPFYGAVVTQQETGKRFENGLVEHNGTLVHVSRGIGMRGYMPRVRFLCRPEIAVIDLYSARGDG